MLSPMIASILSYFILGEPWKLPEFFATVLSLIGATCVAKPPFIFGYNEEERVDPHSFFVGVFTALFSACCAGGAFICVRILGTTAKMPWPWVTFSQAIAQIVMSVPLMYFLGVRGVDGLDWYKSLLILSGAFVGAWSQAAMTIGMQREKSATATAMRMSDVVFGFIWQVLFTVDPVSPLSVLGAVLVTGSILVVVVFKPKPEPPKETTVEDLAAVEMKNMNPMHGDDTDLESVSSGTSAKSVKSTNAPRTSLSNLIATNLRKLSYSPLKASPKVPQNPHRYSRLDQSEHGRGDDDNNR